jgi:alpha-glucosidase
MISRRPCYLLWALLLALRVTAGPVATLASPDGRNHIAVTLDDRGRPSYQVARNGATVLADSPLGLSGEGLDFSRGLQLESAGKTELRRERYELLAGTRPQVDQPHQRRSLVFRNPAGARITVDLDAGNEGVAFRYRFPEAGDGERTLDAEPTGFRLPPDASGWISPYNRSSESSPAYEDYYFAVKPGDTPPPSRGGGTRGWYFPALFHVPSAKSWALITESGSDGNYPGCHLAADSAGGIYRIEFPFNDEGTKGVNHRPDTRPRHSLPWTMPWRVVVLGDSAGEILTSTLVTDLAPPSVIADTSWIHPGRASWSWWAWPEGREAQDQYPAYIHAAAAYSWEYSLLDAGWWRADVKNLAALARRENVKLMLWSHAEDFYDPARRTGKLDEIARRGAVGAKLDFWCSDRQETLAAMAATLRDAAARKLVINFHGCTLPRGWQRTYPNFLAAEAVLGSESYMYDERYPEKAAQLNTLLPFTRNVAGPMDATPLGLAQKRYPRLNSAAHELAAALVFTSGLVHYADQPEIYAGFPEAARRILRDAPARWDETRCLIGEPGRVVVLARRAGASWFIAGLNGTAGELPLTLDLAAFAKMKTRTLIREGDSPLMDLRVESMPLANSLKLTLPPRGGFVLRLE